jgi:branched-chain amino acid transport system ATP-binding protein
LKQNTPRLRIADLTECKTLLSVGLRLLRVHDLCAGYGQVGRKTYEIIRAGIAFVPEERQVFDNLTVEENLVLGHQDGGGDRAAWTIAQMFDYFPRLKERHSTKAARLSGGEQQMLTICRLLLGNPKIILIDEPTLRISDRVHVVGHGRIVYSGTADEIRESVDVRRRWLEVA